MKLIFSASYGDFINNIRCATRIAVDRWPGIADYLNEGVRAEVGEITLLSGIGDHSVDFVFASNIFEHLTKAEMAVCLAEVRRVLRHGGTINIVQPNYRLCYAEYFDDYTHVSVYSDRSLSDLLRANGFTILECAPRFLPLTIKSRLPVWPALIKAYLASPVKPLAKQMWIRARLEARHGAG
ncbi:MAG: class I SAM-dependent methyltransferase [Candidatus Solibacter sp.]|nr:class I SAM-dependent methyltransferase [Candidatus Solibacter sp.]